MAVETIHGVALVSSLKKTTKLMVYFLSIIKQKYHIWESKAHRIE